MKVEEESAQLLAELRQLREQVTHLSERVRALESEASEASEAAPPVEEREGDFGPAIKRSASTRHQGAVNKALTMLGVLPPQAETTKSKELSASHVRALERMKQMGGGEPAAHDGEQSATVDAPSIEADPAALVPLPELRDDTRPSGERPSESTPVELDTALSIDLERPASRAPDLVYLLLEIAIVSGLLLALPVHHGVLASVGFIALLATSQRRVLRAHSRFLSLVVLMRCLFPEVWAVSSPLQLPAMIAACLPAIAVVFVGRVGWALQAIAMSAVVGAIALSQAAAMLTLPTVLPG